MNKSLLLVACIFMHAASWGMSTENIIIKTLLALNGITLFTVGSCWAYDTYQYVKASETDKIKYDIIEASREAKFDALKNISLVRQP